MTVTNTIVINRALDPSQTIVLRNAFASAIKKRFREFRRTLLEVIVGEDVFGLAVHSHPGRGAFAFPDSADKISSFIKWVTDQVWDDILQTTQIEQVGRAVDSAWTNRYIQEAYKRGLTRARSQLKAAGISPSLKITGGIDAAMMVMSHMDRKSALFVRTFNELKGSTDNMIQQISRVLVDGITNGQSKRTIAKAINEVVKKSEARAELIARTEVIRAHADAQLNEYKQWGVHGVSAKAEFLTAGDARVCSRCAALEKQIFSIEEAQGMIPLHPRCRCIWIPYITN